MSPKKVMIIAGEVSGDIHGAGLTEALKERLPDIYIFGIGGPRMKAKGVDVRCDLTGLAVTGFTEVLRHIGDFRSAFNLARGLINSEKPDAIVLIDYPGFNLKLARIIHSKKIPLIYYISLQVWAWGEKRIEKIKMWVDEMVVIFKFEEELYRLKGVKATFVGHPLLDLARPMLEKDAMLRRFSLKDNSPILSLLPGSRENEVKTNLPIMVKTVLYLKDSLKNLQVIIVKSPNLPEGLFKDVLKRHGLEIHLVEGLAYDCLSISDFAFVASGTATLEAAIFTLPIAIIYKVSFLTWLALRHLVRTPHIGLVNVVAGERLVPEFLQYDAKPERIAKFAYEVLRDRQKSAEIKARFSKVKEKLGSPGASQRCAEIILRYIR